MQPIPDGAPPGIFPEGEIEGRGRYPDRRATRHPRDYSVLHLSGATCFSAKDGVGVAAPPRARSPLHCASSSLLNNPGVSSGWA